jgi:hypothetical protein
MNNLAQDKPDYIFIVSLIAIIFVAIYLAMDRFKDAQISDFLREKGQELLAQIDNQKQRKELQSEYDQFVEKVAQQEVPPEEVERFVSGMINLNQAKEKLNKDEFTNIFEKNLATAAEAKPVKSAYNNEKWQKLQQRLKDIIVFEKKIEEAQLNKPELKNSNTFSYAIDDTLNIIINEQLKDSFTKQHELSAELQRLEKEKALKWQKEVSAIHEEDESLKQALKALKQVEAAVSAISVSIDSTGVSASVGSAKPVATPTPSDE